ncbi:ANTH domain-containing protein [Cavenderia fasciculata]|uniref:ANTH domain-containing protein n=1 Tax=Cavenderia fasciculata TaxID=261658 RepID=F4PVD5_CACFS|nr:ANTH domain-containing protein [Cavenderia fasciculata]EGG19949.1 ANTH domain-containing protein [Cavenderia fasciculata]|eukprot:XP_004366932.1 ANTH domain-containing protein [Cavenderia fasciculata]
MDGWMVGWMGRRVMSNAWGKALDQASIVKASFTSDLEKTAIKGTRHKMRVPKEKHVRKLIIYTHERLGPIGDLYMSLLRRLEQPDWIIVLKTLVVFHRLFGGGNVRFLEDLSHRGMIFPLTRFTDMTSTQAHQQSVFIRKYSSYLEEKVFAYREMHCEFEKESFKGLSIDQLLKKIPKMQRQFDALLATHVEEVCDNIITINAFELLLKDSFKIYCNLNDAVLSVLELYFNMTKRDATTALEIYKVFMRETDDIIRFFDSSRRKFHIELPDLSPAPSTVVKGLEEYLRDLDDDHPPMGRPNNGKEQRDNLGSHFKPSNTFDQKKMDDTSFNFDEDLFSSAPNSPAPNSNNHNNNVYSPSIQQQPPPNNNNNNNNNNNSSFRQQHNQYAPAKQPFDPLDPFQISSSQPLSPMINNNNNHHHHNNNMISSGAGNRNSMGNPFDPVNNEKALQIKAAFESSSNSSSPFSSTSSFTMTPVTPQQPNNMNKMGSIGPNQGANFGNMVNGGSNGMLVPMNNGNMMNNGMNNGMMPINNGGMVNSGGMMMVPMQPNNNNMMMKPMAPMNNGNMMNNGGMVPMQPNNNMMMQPNNNNMNRQPSMNNMNMGMQPNGGMMMQPSNEQQRRYGYGNEPTKYDE